MTAPKYHRYMLVDGNALIHRGYHAIPELTTKSGEPTNAVYGFTMILLKAIKDIQPTHIACTFDLAGPTFRHKQYKEYKATRVKADQELYDQIPRVKEVVRALGIPVYEKEGFEADDLLGTLAMHLHQDDPRAEILIATGDLDTLQLVNSRIKVYTLRKGITDVAVYDEKAVRERYGLVPGQMVSYKALRGDPSDNIPGVTGIGEKTAAELIREFKSFDRLYQAIEQGRAEGKIKPRVLQLLKAQSAQARMSYELSQIDCNVPVKVVVPAYDFNAAQLQQTIALFRELEFRSLLNKLPKPPVKSGQPQPDEAAAAEAPANPKFRQDYELVDTPAKLERALKILTEAEDLVLDTETTSLSPVGAGLVGLGLAAAAGSAYYVLADLALSSESLRRLLANPKIRKTGHNLKYDLQVLQAAGFDLRPISFDTMIASYLLNAGTRQHNLDALAFAELGYQMQPIEDLIGKGKNQITMDRVEPAKVSWYCGEDVDMTLRLKQIFQPQLQQEGLQKIFNEIEMPLVAVLAAMETAGIELDVRLLRKLAGEAEIEINELKAEVMKLAGAKFNPNSPQQLKEILFNRLGLQAVDNRKTKTGLSTAAGELEKMRGQHPIIGKILDYRELAKLQNTYLEALPGLVSPKTGRLHTSFNQTVAATGRLSSSDPNLQNIPVRGEGLGSQIRRAFVAKSGYQLLSLDYSQIELRIVAHLAKDENMLRIFRENQDIHTNTAVSVFGVPPEKVTADMRRDAKTINFGILYGLSSFGLSSRIGEVSRAEAKDSITKYFAAYPKVEEYIEQVKLQVNKEGFVRNELGRLRRFPEIRSSQYFIRAAAERAAVNFPIQSLAADVIKVAMINIYKEIRDKGGEVKMLLQVHDELVFEVAEDRVAYWAKKFTPLMEEAISLSVPVRVEGKAGTDWGRMKKL
ncbi:MAG TPA: DNA polymerase I [Patescibacteria group bacterium]|nr:DNA polymerase I [Patescibacteria group bacterium]